MRTVDSSRPADYKIKTINKIVFWFFIEKANMLLHCEMYFIFLHDYRMHLSNRRIGCNNIGFIRLMLVLLVKRFIFSVGVYMSK